MNHEFANWVAVLWLACAVGWLWIANRPRDGGRARTCPRRGCRRMPAGQGCNHAATGEGAPARIFSQEDD